MAKGFGVAALVVGILSINGHKEVLDLLRKHGARW